MPAHPPDPAARIDGLTWDISESGLRNLGNGLLRGCDERLAALLARDQVPTVAGFLTELDRLLLEVRDVGSHGGFLFNVHPDEGVRAAGRELSEASDRFYNAFRVNTRAYALLGAVDLSGADPVTRHTVDKMRQEMRRSGVEQDPPARERLKALSDAIDAVGNQFAQNIATQHREIRLASPADLEGLPEDFVRAHPPGPDGTIRINTTYPDYVPVISYAARADVRRRLMHEFANRAYPENLAVLQELLAKRHEFAGLLHYPAYSALALEDKMMLTRERARTFLKEAADTLRVGSDADHRRLLARKQRDTPTARELDPWDDAFLRNKIQTEEYGVDPRALRAYLPYGPVRDGLFRLCSDLFRIEIRAAPERPLWHASVEAYEVRRAGALVGRFYLDMVPRPGKFSHAACFGVRTGIRDVQLPEAALVCNFVDPKEAKESARMEYRDVVTFFHEFGHLLHAMLSGRMPWTYAHQMEWDFVEAPSQLFEEWARDPATLGRFARDPTNGATIPPELLRKIEAADAFGRPSKCMRQVALSAISFAYYDQDPAAFDSSALYRSIWDAHMPGHLPAEFHPQAAWGHLTGYSACYYTYVWSLVIARDLLTPFRSKGNLTDPTLAQRYADEILAPGGSRPAAESIRAFLGRDFTLDAFRDWVGEADRPPAGPA
ncbi:MAG TPA: M3 family metallopeptidase [Thermoplasmata archaeon]|nr:M3 family metallopeptidase [Thermoplasmata archaeon]